jgi:NADPH:quinone reductase-like Zn-dependent oxidoreductase
MRAVGFSAFGGPEVLDVLELPDPEPGPGEIRVRVAAATVNPADLLLREGLTSANMTASARYVPGLELAGTVDAVGAGADWRVGDSVVVHTTFIPHGRGAMAELVVVHSDCAARMPRVATPVEAATLPMNGLTALRALDVMALPAGATLAVTGAAGAVGGFAVELAAAAGLHVVAVAGASDEELVRALGATAFVARGDDLANRIRAEVRGGVDGAIDAALVGAPLLAAVRDGGQFVAVRPGAPEPERGIEVTLISVRDYLRARDKLEGLVQLVDDGHLTLRVAETFPPERAGDAHRKLSAGGVRGRLVVVFPSG